MPITLPPALLRLAPPPRCVRYARVGVAGDFPLPRLTIEESWNDPTEQDGRQVYRRVSRVVSDTPRIIEDALIGYGPDGLTDLGTYKDDVLTLWDPPQVVLPPAPTAGDTWEATHTRGETTSDRSVELMACNIHRRCLVVVSTSKRETGALIMRSHYAEGEGFCGFEALSQTTSRPAIRIWSESITITSRRS
ncbi:MAG: hypothetical protein ACI8RZ_005429 [Myxococcota bacterium]|jgi:hypothetical protein